MAYLSLSKNDINVLEKIKDPEADPTAMVPIEPHLPRDPNITDASVYSSIVAKEREILMSIQRVELQPTAPTIAQLETAYRDSLARLGVVIDEHPKYASARNNRAQALRRLYGDGMLVEGQGQSNQAVITKPSAEDRRNAGKMALDDLDTAIRLLTPATISTPVSPQTAKTLSMAYTQRAAIYHATAKALTSDGNKLDISGERRESGWKKMDFEEAAARDFAMGGRYGSEIAKGLAVSVNPTAKLCGQIVREAMKKEYGPAYSS